MKRVLPEFEFSNEQLNEVRRLAVECGLCEETVKILYGRGVRDKDAINVFMNPSRAHFISPFKMSGMTEAANLIKTALEEDWSVVVFGDYDADGICAATIMGKALREYGIKPVVVVPERSNGYGLSQKMIDDIFDEYFPQLFITVDCGISCAEEVEYLKELGAEVIVTDHHELPDNLPDCICINPKIEDGYPYDNLCGAGVAFKIACALLGEEGYKYLDFAAIATVADSVPLTGENRDIVYEGLKIIRETPSKTYKEFLNKTDVITSQTLAFTLAPKINAAGRMGDAKAALALFDTTDDNKIFDLSAKLTAYNIERQRCCDELYLSAKEMLKAKGSVGRIILLCNESWNSGFVGIVAARLVDEFGCPVILFVKNGNMLKGSARSIENVNIYEALKACEEHLVEFGGHSQAAGVNVTEENFENLNRALEEYMSSRFADDDFIPTVYVNGSLSDDFSPKFVKEMELLEPFGVGNRRPMFETDINSLPVRQLKPASPHISMKNQCLEFMFFYGARFSKLLTSSVQKKLIFEYNISSFKGKEYIKGFIRDVIYGDEAREAVESETYFWLLESLSLPKVECETIKISREEVEKLMENRQTGVLFISWDNSVLDSYKNIKGLNCDLFFSNSRNFHAAVLFAPAADADLSAFERVVVLDNLECAKRLPSLAGKRLEEVDGAPTSEVIKILNSDREKLLNLFGYISSNFANSEGATAEEVTKNSKSKNKAQLYFSLKVFEQLSLISFAEGRLTVVRGVKNKLENSLLYSAVKEISAE